MKVKIFTEISGGEEFLEDIINDWFKANPNITINDKLVSSNQHRFVIFLFYTEELKI